MTRQTTSSKPSADGEQTATVPAPSNKLSAAPSAQMSSAPPEDDASESLRALQDMVNPDNLRVVFQPIITLETGELYAQEALVRCDIPKYKAPPVLFEAAVEQGCTGRLGRMIREIGVPLCAGTPLFVNIHPMELSEGWLVRPDDPIFNHDHLIYLEVTESAPLMHRGLCMGVLKEVGSRAGVHLVIDDLGAGYSNLLRIAELEPRIVKLDRALISNLHQSKRQRTLVTSIVELCVNMGADVVAEGIETVEEWMAVQETGAQYGQGYLFARPDYPPPEVQWPPKDEEAPPDPRDVPTIVPHE